MAIATGSKTIGGLFLLAILLYASGMYFVESIVMLQSQAGTTSRIDPGVLDNLTEQEKRHVFLWGICLMLGNSAVVIVIGGLMARILIAERSSGIAFIYFGARIVESVMLCVGVMSYLSLLTLADQKEDLQANQQEDFYFSSSTAVAVRGNYFAYQIAMLVLPLGSCPMCYVLYERQMVPTPLAAWGFVGYLCLFAGPLLEFFGYAYGITMSIPGGLFELVFGVWLLFGPHCGRGLQSTYADYEDKGNPLQ